MSRRSRRTAVAAAALAAAALLTPAPAFAATGTALVGTVTGPTGELLAGITVRTSGAQGAAVSAVTNSHGRYRITGAATGNEIAACGTPPTNYHGGTVKPGYLENCNSAPRAASGPTTVDVQLPAAAGMSGRIIDDRTGKPLAGAPIATTEYGRAGIGLPGPTTVTAADGSWTIRELDPQSSPWYVCVEGPANSGDAPFGYVDEKSSSTCSDFLTLTAGTYTRGLSYRLPPAARISGTVTGPGDLGNVGIDTGTARASIQGGTYTVDPVAHYGSGPLDGRVCALTGTSYVKPLGYAVQCTTAPFSATTETTSVDFSLAVGGALRGTIAGAARGTSVWVDVQGYRVLGGVVDSAGRYYVGGLPTGSYTVYASDDSGTTGHSTPVRVTQNQVRNGVNFSLH